MFPASPDGERLADGPSREFAIPANARVVAHAVPARDPHTHAALPEDPSAVWIDGVRARR